MSMRGSGCTPKESKKKKKKKENVNMNMKEKKPKSATKKRNYSSPASISDDTDKPQAPEFPQGKLKVQPKPPTGKGNKKARGAEEPEQESKVQSESIQQDPTAPQAEVDTELSSLLQDSLRWEGVLEDPLEEEKRLEVYRANRRRRYFAAQLRLETSRSYL